MFILKKKIFSRDELEHIATLCKKHDVIVISDEVYEWLFYPGTEHIRMGKFSQGVTVSREHHHQYDYYGNT